MATYCYNPMSSQIQYYHICMHEKMIGIMKLQKRCLTFESNDNSRKVEINIDQITSIEKTKNENNNTELVRIKTFDNTYIFRFFDITPAEFQSFINFQGLVLPLTSSTNSNRTLNKEQARNKIFDLLETRNYKDNDSIIKDVFNKKITNEDRISIKQILTNDDLFILYKELCSSNILRQDEFWKFIRKKYNNIYCTRYENSNQVYSLARYDEMFLKSLDNINFDLKLMNKILSSNKDLYLVYNEIKKTKSNKEFWRDFISGQINAQSVLAGGFNPVFISEENLILIKNKRSSSKNNHSISFNPLTLSINQLAVPQTMQGNQIQNYWNFNYLNSQTDKEKINTSLSRIIHYSSINLNRLKMSELNDLYTNSFEGPYKSKNEYDNCDIILKNEFNIEDRDQYQITNLIQDINNYSINKVDKHISSSTVHYRESSISGYFKRNFIDSNIMDIDQTIQ